MRKHLSLFVIAIVLLIAASCGGSDTPSEQTNATAPTTEATAVTTTNQSEEDVEPVTFTSDSPVEAMLGVPVFDEDAMNKWFEELDIERRRVTAECMISNGFEYSAESPNTATQFKTELATTSREFAVNHGYGIVAAFNAAEYDPDKEYGTKNTRYLATLTEPETDAYYIALFGSTPDEEFVESNEAEGEDTGFGVGGCLGQALEEVFEIVGVLDSLGPVADEYYDQILADSRSIRLYDDWSACMAESGFNHALPEDARESFYGRLESVINDESAYQQDEIPEEAQQSGILVDFSGDSYSTHPQLTEQAQVELDELEAEERATAIASWDCYEPLRDEEIAIQREYEAKFVEEVGPQLAADQASN